MTAIGVPQTSPAVSVIVPACNAAATLERTLEALRVQELDAEFEVIVVDDASQDQTSALARRYAPLVKLVRTQTRHGAGLARNRGVSVARADILAFTDSDCFPTRTWLARGLEGALKADLVQGRVLPEPAVCRTPFDRSLSVDNDGGFYQTANLFVHRRVFDAVGGFKAHATPPRDSSGLRKYVQAQVRPVGEDTLFAWQARRLGASSHFADDAVVHHVVTPGCVRAAAADRWNWTTKMPGLALVVPELRDAVFYRRWFFADWTAQFDLAVVGLVATAITKRRLALLVSLPYVRRVLRETNLYRDGRDSRMGGVRRAARYVLGAPAVDAATLAGLIVGSIAWRRLLL